VIFAGLRFLMETASVTGSAGAGFKVERELYNIASAGKLGSMETDLNCGSDAVITGRLAGAWVAAGAAGACVAAGAAGLAGAWVAAGAGAPQAEINIPISKITTKDFRDIKAPAKYGIRKYIIKD
jgi:hypothetical protein